MLKRHEAQLDLMASTKMKGLEDRNERLNERLKRQGTNNTAHLELLEKVERLTHISQEQERSKAETVSSYVGSSENCGLAVTVVWFN